MLLFWFPSRRLPSSKPKLETGLIQLAQFGSGAVVASVYILVSNSDVAIQQTRIGDRIDSIGTIRIGCGGFFCFYFGFRFGRCHPANPYCREDCFNWHNLNRVWGLLLFLFWFLIRMLPSSKPELETGLIPLAQFGSGVVVAFAPILVSNSDVAIQQTRIGDRIDSIGTIRIGCGGFFCFYFGFRFGRCHPANPYCREDCFNWHNLNRV